MLSSLAQLIALAAHGNAYLAGYETSDFYPNNSAAFQYCSEVRFVTPMEASGVNHKCVDPSDWFGLLKSNNCRRLVLGHRSREADLPDHISVAFVGGGSSSYILSDLPEQSVYWFGRWESSGGGAFDSRVWRVTYTGVAANRELVGQKSGAVESWKRKLAGILAEIEGFDASHQCGFATCFRKALEALECEDATLLAEEAEGLPVVGYRLEAKQLLAAAWRSWVFGGMGSWNDIVIEDQGEYERYEYLSQELYSAIISSIEESVNSFEAPSTTR
jgi:hypothetical protein